MDKLLKYVDVKAFKETLPYMGKGMLGIFIITIVIIACVYLMNKFGSIKKDQ